MPEGDTVYRVAHRLNEVFAGHTLTEFDVRVPGFAAADFTGQRVTDVTSRGKHLLLHVEEWSIRSHLKMEGSWHVYRRGTRWKRPAYQARIVVGTAEWQGLGFDLGTLEIVPRVDEESLVGHLGPDLLGPDWDPDEALARLSSDAHRPIGVALLDQRNLAGLGNVYANELCFLRGMRPHQPVSDPESLRATVRLAHRLILANRDRPERTTTGDTRPGRRTYVYGRAGEPCRRCGTRVEYDMLGADELSERDTYWCPSCQR